MTAFSSGEEPASMATDAPWARAGARLAACQLAASIGFVAIVQDDAVELIGLHGAEAAELACWLPTIAAMAAGDALRVQSSSEHGEALAGLPFALAADAGRGLIGGIGGAVPDGMDEACLADLAMLVASQAAAAAELAHARAELAASGFRERRLRAAFDGLPQHFWMTDAEARYVEQNAKDREVFGDLLGRAAHEADPPLEEAARWHEHHRRVLAGETLQFAAWRRQPDLPGERYVETIMAPLALDGSIVGHVGVTIDRTEQAEVERRLAESEGRLKAALDALPFPFFICDAAGRHVMQNRIDLATWGDGIGKTHAELDLPPELLTCMPEVMASVLGGEPFSKLVRYRIAGRLRDIEEIYAPVYAQGEVSGFVGVAIDHTDRMEVERRLTESEARLHAALDALPYPFFIYDAEGRLAVANKVDRAIWGDHIGRHFTEIGLPPVVVDHMRRVIPKVRDGETDRTLLRYQLQGRLADVEEVFAPVYTDDRVTSIVGLIIDHTDRVDAERRLRQSEAHLKAIIDALPCALFVCDLEGRHVMQNRVDRTLWGDCVGKTYAEADLPAEIKNQVPAILQRIGSGQTMRSQVGYDQDGQRREIEEIYAPVYDHGTVTGFVGLAIDHTDRIEAERRVRRSESRLADYLATASDWLWEADAEHRITSLDGANTCEAIPASLLIGKRRWELAGVDPSGDPNWRGYYEDVVARRPIRGFVYAYPSAESAEIWIEISGHPVFDDHGVFQGYRGTARDVTERCRAEAALREAHARLEMLTHSGLIGIASGRSFLIEEANDAFLDMVGLDRRALAGKGLDWRTITPPEQVTRELADTDDPRRLEQTKYSYEKVFSRPDGSHVPVLINVVVLEPSQNRWFALVQDLTPMKLAEERVRDLAERDVLTGLANRHVLFEQLKGDLDERRRPGSIGALFMLDLDNFKEINDTLGHEAGDQLLQTVGARIAEVVRETDTIARLGGDEFALVLRRLDGPAAAAEVAEKVLAALGSPLDLDGREVQPKASIGIALFPADGRDATELLRRADIALYQAKARGRGIYCFFEPALLSSIERRRQIAGALQAAVAKDDFQVALQPQLHLTTGDHAGLEALVRWRLDGRSLPPDEFITIAVESGCIVPMGRIVRRQALEAWRRCAAAGLRPGTLAVNVSAAELKQPDFARELAELLAAVGVAPELFEIEVTENALFDRDAETVAATLGELERLGIGITLDDFGTGYASLTHLKRFPVDRLKIDRAFVRDIGVDDEGDAVIVRSIINLAHTLGLSVVAEGVETAAQEAFLKRHRCDLAQGFRFAEPLAPADLERYLARRANHGMAGPVTADWA